LVGLLAMAAVPATAPDAAFSARVALWHSQAAAARAASR
jgi:hypothetical protein